MTYHCPECKAKALPPAVMPNSYRLCAKCGLNFEPWQTVVRGEGSGGA